MTGALMEFQDVYVRFGGLRALSDVRLTIRKGELLALIGPNGAGKTTLLNVATGAIRATTGTVRFRGEDITGEPPHRINARGIARTFQAAELFDSLTVQQNVMAGGVSRSETGLLDGLAGWGRGRRVRDKLDREARELLGVVGLEGRAADPASVLPAGQQRLLGIARALATGAELLFLDEPGAGLNEVEKNALIRVIMNLGAMGKTIVFVEHDMTMVGRLAQRVIVLDQGRVIADGPPPEVRNDPAVITAYLGRSDRIPRVRAVAPESTERPGSPLLRVESLTVSYRGVTAVDRVSLNVHGGEIVALVGPNGAGKSSLLKAVARAEAASAAVLSFEGRDLRALNSEDVVRLGISLAPEGRQLFASLSVADNLAVGRYARLSAAGLRNLVVRAPSQAVAMEAALVGVHELFPVLRERNEQLAGTLSGGQGQMLAIGRALMASPRLLLLDEPSLGLAPQVVDEILDRLLRLRAMGFTILLVEQNARAALEVADWGYVMSTGRIVADGPAGNLLANAQITEAYLGWGNTEIPSLRVVRPTGTSS